MGRFKIKAWLFKIVTLLFSSGVFASVIDFTTSLPSGSILPPSQVFKVAAKLTQQQVVVYFEILPNYYIYKNSLKITALPPAKLDLTHAIVPKALTINVPQTTANGTLSMQPEEVFTGSFEIKLPQTNPDAKQEVKINVSLQGCDGKSVCYPPQHYQFSLNANKAQLVAPANKDAAATSSLLASFQHLYTGEVSRSTLLTQLNLANIIFIFFIAGIAIALTPCMYPLYPIALSAIIGNNKPKSQLITFKLAWCYLQGIALIYVIMGIIAATSGKLLTTLMQTPLFILTSAAILLLLGLAMFDLLEVKLSTRLQNYLQLKTAKLIGGSYTTAFILGLFSSLLLGPCITPPLITAIGFIAHEGSVLIGVLGLYAIAMGMGVPILLLATLGNKLLPKSGRWMELVKHLLGAVIITASIYLAYPFISLGNHFISIGVLCSAVALIFLLIKHFRSSSLELLVHQRVPILMLILGIIFTVYGSRITPANIVVPATVSNQNLINSFIVVNKKAELDRLIKQSTQPIIIEVYANWCTVCKEMEVTTFKQSQLQQALTYYTRIKFDITTNLPEYYQMLTQYGLYGPPAIILLDKQHKVVDLMVGFVSSDTLIEHLSRAKQ